MSRNRVHPSISRMVLAIAMLLLNVVPVWSEDEPTVKTEKPAQGDWPQFRGPTGQGIATQTGLPIEWSMTKNIRWRTSIPGTGWSSPVIARGQIWLTTAMNGGRSLHAVCIDETDGTILHNVELFQRSTANRIHTKNTQASPTPVIDGDRIFVHFGANGTAALDRDGKVLWSTSLPYYHHHGPAASPVVIQSRLIIPCDGFTGPFYDKTTLNNVGDPQFVAALNPLNGEVVWKQPREGLHSYSTPLVIEVAGRSQIVCPGGKRVTAYDPQSGEVRWSVRYGDGYSVVPCPVFGNGLVYVCTGYDTPWLLAIRPDGHGDVTDSHVTWKSRLGIPLVASPVLDGTNLFLVSDVGVLTCLDAIQGTKRWQGRLGGTCSSSPLLAGGRLYVSNEAGVTHVIDPSPTTLARLASNKLDGRILASSAVTQRSIVIRTEHSLFRIEQQVTDEKPSSDSDSPDNK